MEVYWAGGEHGEGGYKDVGKEVVGYIQWWELGLRELICKRTAVNGGAFGGRRSPVHCAHIGCLDDSWSVAWADRVFDFYFFVVDWSLLCLWMLDVINDATTPLGFYWLSCLKFWDRDRMWNQFYFLKLFLLRENNYFPNLKSLETIKAQRLYTLRFVYDFEGQND